MSQTSPTTKTADAAVTEALATTNLGLQDVTTARRVEAAEVGLLRIERVRLE